MQSEGRLCLRCQNCYGWITRAGAAKIVQEHGADHFKLFGNAMCIVFAGVADDGKVWTPKFTPSLWNLLRQKRCGLSFDTILNVSSQPASRHIALSKS